jgi:membrane fusion protein, multidrug efflux system
MSFRIVQILALVLCSTILLSCNQEPKPSQSLPGAKEKAKTIVVEEATLSREVMLPGELKPWNRVSIMARVRGYVGQVAADRGDLVKKGQTLSTLEAPEIVAELNAIRGRVASAKATAIEMESRLRASALTYQRMLMTSQTKGAVSANEIDLAYSKMMADSSLTTSVRATVDATLAQLTSQQQLVNYLTVTAPFDGIIIERNISPGALVGNSDQGLPMFVLEDQTKLRLTVAIPENMANSIPEGSKVDFTVPASPGETFQAQFARSSNSLLELNRSMPAEFDVQNPNGELKAGMYAEVSVPIARNKTTLVVPTTALISTSEGVYVIGINGAKAIWKSVQKGNQVGAQVEVFGDIKAGDHVILIADPEIRDGQEI